MDHHQELNRKRHNCHQLEDSPITSPLSLSPPQRWPAGTRVARCCSACPPPLLQRSSLCRAAQGWWGTGGGGDHAHSDLQGLAQGSGTLHTDTHTRTQKEGGGGTIQKSVKQSVNGCVSVSTFGEEIHRDPTECPVQLPHVEVVPTQHRTAQHIHHTPHHAVGVVCPSPSHVLPFRHWL